MYFDTVTRIEGESDDLPSMASSSSSSDALSRLERRKREEKAAVSFFDFRFSRETFPFPSFPLIFTLF